MSWLQNYECMSTKGNTSIYLNKKTNKKIFLRSEDLVEGSYELSILKHLDGKCFPELFDFEVVNQKIEIAYHFIDGEKISAYHPPNIGTLSNVITNCFIALDYLHDFGVLHNNINPNNLIVSPKGFVHIINFKNASFMKAKSEYKFENTLIRFASPEFILNPTHIDYRSDYFSLSKTLLHCFNDHIGSLSLSKQAFLNACSEVNIHNRPKNIQALL